MIDLSIVPNNEPFQRLRVKRFLMAGLVYVVAIGVMGLYVAEGLLAVVPWLGISAAIVIINLATYIFLRSGRNERMRDPSLTGIQMLAACALMTASLLYVHGARGAILLMYLVLFMFGVFRLRSWQFTALGLLAMACYGGAIVVVHELRPWAVDPREETLQLVALAVMVPCGGFFAGYVDRLRRQLRRQQVELQRAREQVHDLSVLDPLTGLSNRRTIIDAVAEEVARGQRIDQPLAVAVLDLDGFKAVNQKFGYEVGDRVLQQVAKALRSTLGTVDSAGRYGGEEFVIIFPDTSTDDAHERAQRLRRQILNCRFHELGTGNRVTASVGVTELRADDDVWQLLGRARAAANDASDDGGNRVISR